MRQVSIIVAKDQLPNLLAFAGSKKIVHLTEVKDDKIPDGAQRYQAGELLARASTVRNRIAALTSALPIDDSTLEKIDAPLNNLEALSNFLDGETSKLEQSVRELEHAKGKLQTDMEQTSELSRFVSGLENVGLRLDSLTGDGFLASLVGEATSESIPSLRNELDQITYGNLIFAITNTSGKAQTFLAIFPGAFQEDAKQAITALGATLGPPWVDLPADPKKAKETIDLRQSNLESLSKELEQKRVALARDHGPRIKSLGQLSEILDVRAKAIAGASTTEDTVLLQGWVPKSQIHTLTEGASKSTNGLVSVYEEEKRDHGDDSPELTLKDKDSEPPTLVNEPGWTRPLQSIIDNFGIPSYGETNPLPFMILTFPLIFGLMFGDVGEGSLFLLFGIFLLYVKRTKAVMSGIRQIFVNGAELIVMLGISAIIFGFVFGDFFGFDMYKLFGFRPVFSPTEGAFDRVPPDTTHLLLYMIVIIFFGAAHLLSGLAISTYNMIRNKDYRRALLGPVAWAWFYSSFIYAAVLVVQSGFKFSILMKNPLVILSILVPIGIMGYEDGGLHVMEAFIGAGSNTLSYLRIWALNLADFAVKFAFFAAGGIVGAIMGNVLVMILEGLIVFVQTLRLHWVEWFGKFYEGSGHAFAPYQEPMNWTVSH